jgi:hypothetical protein
VGESWEVAFFPLNSSIMAKNGNPSNSTPSVGKGLALRYEVMKAEAGATTLKLTPIEKPGLDADATRRGETFLVIDRELRTVTLSFPAQASPARAHVLELLPLALPDLTLADSQAGARLEPLPAEISRFAREHGAGLASGDVRTFSAEDGFGRGITLSWVRGRPWPSTIRTQNGVALLLGAGTVAESGTEAR